MSFRSYLEYKICVLIRSSVVRSFVEEQGSSRDEREVKESRNVEITKKYKLGNEAQHEQQKIYSIRYYTKRESDSHSVAHFMIDLIFTPMNE